MLVLAWMGALGCALPEPRVPGALSSETCKKLGGSATPALCIAQESTDIFVVGLPLDHGWKPGNRVLVEVEEPSLAAPMPAAMLLVMEPYPRAVRVDVLYQVAGKQSLHGSRARLLRDDERARLGKYVARIAEKSGTLVRIDLGAEDGVEDGDVYRIVTTTDGAPIGRIRITQRGPLTSWGKLLETNEEVAVGMNATYFGDALTEAHLPVSILVIDFDPADEADDDEWKLGRSFAKELSGTLERSSQGLNGVSVRYGRGERVRLGAGSENGDEQARSIGRRHAADIVVWGTLRCSERVCVQPRFTVVNPSSLGRPLYGGLNLVGQAGLPAGGASIGIEIDDPIALACALLGRITFDAGLHAEAAYYLQRALAKNVLEGEEEVWARVRLSSAFLAMGQPISARAQAETYRRLASDLRPQYLRESFALMHQLMVIVIDSHEGDLGAVRRALTRLEKRLETSQNGYHGLMAFAAQMFASATIYVTSGRVDEARASFEALWPILVEIRNRGFDQEGTLHAQWLQIMAHLDSQEGKIESALKRYGEALDVFRRTGNLVGQVQVLQSITLIHFSTGKLQEARAHAKDAHDIAGRTGNPVIESGALVNQAILETSAGRLKEAEPLARRAHDLAVRGVNPLGQAVALQQLAIIDRLLGRTESSRMRLDEALQIQLRAGPPDGAATPLLALSSLDTSAGRLKDARARAEAALERCSRTMSQSCRGTALQALVALDLLEGRFDDARRKADVARALAKRTRLLVAEQMALVSLGNVARREERHEDARKAGEEALDLADRIGDKLGRVNALALLSNVDQAEEKTAAAMTKTEAAIRSCREASALECEAIQLHNLAYLQYVGGDSRKARATLRDAIGIAKRGPFLYVLTGMELLMVRMDLEEDVSGGLAARLEGLYATARATGNADAQATALEGQGEVAFSEGRLTTSLRFWKAAKTIHDELHNTESSTCAAQSLLAIQRIKKAWRSHRPLLQGSRGVVVLCVLPRKRAEKAGLQAGDALMRYNSKRLDRYRTYFDLTYGPRPRRSVALDIVGPNGASILRAEAGPLGIWSAKLPSSIPEEELAP